MKTLRVGRTALPSVEVAINIAKGMDEQVTIVLDPGEYTVEGALLVPRVRSSARWWRRLNRPAQIAARERNGAGR